MMAYTLFLTVVLSVISHNSVSTIEPEMSETCAFLCGSEIQQIYHIINNLKNNMSEFEMKEKRMQSQIDAMEGRENDMLSKIDALEGKEEGMKMIIDAMVAKEEGMQTIIEAMEQKEKGMHILIEDMEVKEGDMQSQINALETKSGVRDLREQNENLIELKTNCTIIEEKYSHQQTEIDDLRDTNSALKGNMSSLQSENEMLEQRINQLSSLQSENQNLEQRINQLESVLNKSAGISNCADLYKLGQREDKVYTFDQGGKLYCDMSQDGGGWTVIQRRFNGSVNFYRNWDTYKAGFGDLNTEFWLGNDLISLLTKYKKFDLFIYLEDFEGNHRYAEYSEFQLGDEKQKYALNIGSYSGDAGDALTYHKGMHFSTYDSDNDGYSPLNCASKHQGGFWFRHCRHAHLNGQYSATGSGAPDGGLTWSKWKGVYYSLKKTIIKIRPMGF